ncbi:unnamed protein product [Symbiodinium sp. CCMP2592]|nr:unnamed protein product [Symbiodinium sp. CCMP2592]
MEESPASLRAVMQQIEQLIQSLLGERERQSGPGPIQTEELGRRGSVHSVQLSLPNSPRRPSITHTPPAFAPPAGPPSITPGSVPEDEACPSPSLPPMDILGSHVQPPKKNPKTLNPQLSQVSFASQASHQSRQVTPSDDGTVSERLEGFDGFKLQPAWVKRQQEQSTMRIKPVSSTVRGPTPTRPHVMTLVPARALKPLLAGSRISILLDWKPLWGLIAGALILFDCLFIPLLAFEVREPWAFDLIRILFWSLSLPIIYSFSSQSGCLGSRALGAFVSDGLLEVLLLVLILCSLVQGNDLSLEAQFLLRGPELLRLRYVKKLTGVRGLPRWLVRQNRGELQRLEVRAAANLFYTLLACLIGFHLLTCAWFAAGQAEDGWGTTGLHADLAERSVPEQYRITLEWAISRIPPSKTTDNVLLATQLERAIALAATAMSLLAASIFTSIVTNDMSDIRRVQRQQGEAYCQLSDFLETFPVSWTLERQLKNYLKQTVKRVTLPSKREMATLLPDMLHGQLCSEALGAILSRHQMFKGLMEKYPSFQRDLCVKGLEDWTLAPDEVLFSAGLSCQNMLFVAFNFVLYKRQGVVLQEERSRPSKVKTWTLRHGQSWNSQASAQASPMPVLSSKRETEDLTLRIKPGHWLCEPCLWTDWRYLGQAVAGSSASLLCLNQSQLLHITAGHADISAELVIHARLFLNALNDIPAEELSDVQRVL